VAIAQFSDAHCLAFVERSPAAVAAHDEAAWIALFANYSVVEDPVGSAPHVNGVYDARSGYRSRERLHRFYQTFIAPNTIRFLVDADIVCGSHVVRDLTIEITMSPGMVVRVPVHLLYELTVEDAALRILRLAAHWELWPMLKQQIGAGGSEAGVGSAAGARMLRHFGITGVVGFLRALRSVGEPGKVRVEAFRRHLNAGDAGALQALCLNADMEVACPHAGTELTLQAFARQVSGMQFSKLLAAGNCVTATLDCQYAGRHYHGVALFELQRSSLLVTRLALYWSEP
jgi:hypothetical protein